MSKTALRDPWMAAAAAVVVVAFALRIAYLGSESLWADELFTLRFSWYGPVAAVASAARDTGPPLYYVLQSLLLLAVPASEFTLRIISAVAGTLSVWLTFVVGRRLYGKEVGLVGAGVMAVSSIAIAYGQEARAYSLAVLTVLVSCWTLLRLLDRPSWPAHGWYALSLAAAAYSHLFAGMAVAGMALGVLLRPRLVRRLGWRWGASIGAASVLFLPWAVVLAEQTRRVMGLSEGGQWLVGVPESLTLRAYEVLATYTPLSTERPLVSAIFIGLVIAGLGSGLGSRTAHKVPAGGGPFELDSADIFALMTGWLAIVLIGGLLVTKYVVPIFTIRNAIVTAPALYLLFSRGLLLLRRPLAYALLVALLAVGLPELGDYYREDQKEDVRGVTQHLIASDTQGEGLLACTGWVLPNVSAYAMMLGEEGGLEGTEIARHWPTDRVQREVEAALTGRDSVHVVLSHVSVDDSGRTIVDRAVGQVSGWRLANSTDFNGIWVNHYIRE